MKKDYRKPGSFLGPISVVLALTFGTPSVQATEYSFRLANVLSNTDVTAYGLNKFAELVSEKSNGDIEVKVFHGGQLGSGVETFEAVKNGHLDFAADSFANLATITPAFEVFHFPFLFESRTQLLNTMSSEKVQKQVNLELEPVGLRWFKTFEIGGPREVGTSKKKIETAADLEGMKFRASRSPLEIAAHQSWGAAGVTVDWPETPEAVRLGMVDGLTVPFASFYSAKFHEGDLINYILDLNFQNYALVLVVNDAKYAELPENVRKVLEEAAEEASQWHIAFVSDFITENITAMKKEGVEVYSLPEAEYRKVREKTIETVWPQFVGNEGMSQEKIDLIRQESGEIGDDGWGYKVN
ncbi:2,3-diketo-L-gulonate-binding periplasmic protein YiaO precursor (plasmid) [Labrenzia sp. THAF191b]|uniref:TRAP transporter substrate-binding protein n=1 Tax=unclassified Labrenzia TaxID=2648686 RepID=UPI00126791FF|nr:MULTISPECIES: TRAP transporter substrate-binding protein [unclassified Labrenzia]QFT01648.1 2,3-diketo-L-gulonate-binding periplasmic protein YiaO precursor [Labrenzia sp. THAF191b]QFT07853.1 2,3-diketo-L-gulonate-binding periplasmic protein YiaO precursor [Labrenzia sp. THAF191a]QFT19281.1 2,3-diketo-L-gulonate-binding periplasmic protein YiaO precursor [Labrenzia sp. THAF187b]